MLEDNFLFDFNVVNMPPRSKVYAIRPIKVGTTEVESLLHYWTRLANAHSISARHFISDVIFPEKSMDEIGNMKQFLSFDSQDCLVTKLTHLSCVNEIASTTILYWRGVLAEKDVFRSTRAWCTECLFDAVINNTTIYEKLSWTIKGVECCTIHGTKLREQCPSCNKKCHITISRQFGYCTSCDALLGIEEINPIYADPQEIQITNSINELLLSHPFIDPPRMNSMAEILPPIIINQFNNNISLFAKACNVSIETIRNVYYKKYIPTLETYKKISCVTGIALTTLLDCRRTENNLTPKNNNQVLFPTKKLDSEPIKQALLEITQLNPPISLNESSRLLSITKPRLRRNFPELTDQIIRRYKDYYLPHLDSYTSRNNYNEIQKCLAELLEDKTNPPKPYNESIRDLRLDPNTILRKFPVLARGLSTKYQRHLKESKTYKSKQIDLTLDQLKGALYEIINSDKRIIMSEVCEQLGYDQVLLNSLFPEEYKLITERGKHLRRQQLKKKKEQLFEIIISAMNDLHNRGQYPSINLIRELLSMPHLFRHQDEKKVWQDALKNLKYQ